MSPQTAAIAVLIVLFSLPLAQKVSESVVVPATIMQVTR